MKRPQFSWFVIGVLIFPTFLGSVPIYRCFGLFWLLLSAQHLLSEPFQQLNKVNRKTKNQMKRNDYFKIRTCCDEPSSLCDYFSSMRPFEISRITNLLNTVQGVEIAKETPALRASQLWRTYFVAVPSPGTLPFTGS